MIMLILHKVEGLELDKSLYLMDPLKIEHKWIANVLFQSLQDLES